MDSHCAVACEILMKLVHENVTLMVLSHIIHIRWTAIMKLLWVTDVIAA